MIGRSPECITTINVEHKLVDQKGLAQFFNFSCTECQWMTTFCSFKQTSCTKEATVGKLPYEVNTRAVISFREIGHALSGIESFCRNMNMPEPMTNNYFQNISSKLNIAYVTVAKQSMSKATEEIRKDVLQENYSDDKIVETKTTQDGT